MVQTSICAWLVNACALATDPPPRRTSTTDVVDSWTYQGSSNDNQYLSEVASRCQRPQQSYSLHGRGILELFDNKCRHTCRPKYKTICVQKSPCSLRLHPRNFENCPLGFCPVGFEHDCNIVLKHNQTKHQKLKVGDIGAGQNLRPPYWELLVCQEKLWEYHHQRTAAEPPYPQ